MTKSVIGRRPFGASRGRCSSVSSASATWNRAYARGNWQTTLAWGRDANDPGRTLDAFLLDSAASLDGHTVFGRLENADKDELFDDHEASPLHGRSFNVSKLSLGYFYTVPVTRWAAVDLGGLVHVVPRQAPE